MHHFSQTSSWRFESENSSLNNCCLTPISSHSAPSSSQIFSCKAHSVEQCWQGCKQTWPLPVRLKHCLKKWHGSGKQNWELNLWGFMLQILPFLMSFSACINWPIFGSDTQLPLSGSLVKVLFSLQLIQWPFSFVTAVPLNLCQLGTAFHKHNPNLQPLSVWPPGIVFTRNPTQHLFATTTIKA